FMGGTHYELTVDELVTKLLSMVLRGVGTQPEVSA
ncbi:MAG: TetR/AcrR family transcriptional regulator, partial [Lancefieldella rimae]|nr:TetR/AcrR family transcriptional regulator [Lancefieldella rimae]